MSYGPGRSRGKDSGVNNNNNSRNTYNNILHKRGTGKRTGCELNRSKSGQGNRDGVPRKVPWWDECRRGSLRETEVLRFEVQNVEPPR